jgi:hypothetical protein
MLSNPASQRTAAGGLAAGPLLAAGTIFHLVHVRAGATGCKKYTWIFVVNTTQWNPYVERKPIRQEPMITTSVCVSHSRWALLAQWM